MRLERDITQNGSNTYDLADYWGQIRLCFDIEVLPDQLEDAGISWKYYANENAWMNALQMIRHVRYGPMWQKVRPPTEFVQDVRRGEMPEVSWIVPDESYNEHPGAGKSTRRRELDRAPGERDHEERVLAFDRDRRRLGRLRRPYDRSPAPGRHHGARPADAGADHLAVHGRGGQPGGGAVDDTTYEFSSVLAFIERVFDLDPMTKRDRDADPLSGAFDFRTRTSTSSCCPFATTAPTARRSRTSGRRGPTCGRSGSPATERPADQTGWSSRPWSLAMNSRQYCCPSSGRVKIGS